MALTGWSGSNKLRKAAVVADPGWPVTMMSWGYMVTAAQGVALGLYASTSSNDDDYHQIGPRPSPFQIVTRSASSSGGNAAQTINMPSASWVNILGYISATNSRTIFANGANKVTDTGSRTPVGIDRTSMGARDNVSSDTPWPSTGHLATTAMWSVILSDSDVASLAAGMDPLLMHPEALLLLNHLDVAGGPDLVSEAAFGVVGTLSTSDIGPPIFRAS